MTTNEYPREQIIRILEVGEKARDRILSDLYRYPDDQPKSIRDTAEKIADEIQYSDDLSRELPDNEPCWHNGSEDPDLTDPREILADCADRYKLFHLEPDEDWTIFCSFYTVRRWAYLPPHRP